MEKKTANPKPRKVRIGFVGVGSMGQCAHLKSYVTVPDCEVVALAEIRPELAKKVAARYGVPTIYASHDEMLAKEKLDGIVASQPFTRHGTLVLELLKARVPLFTEKPLAGTIQMGERIVKALADSGTWLMVGYHKRSDPATMYAKDTIEKLKASGEIGKLKYVRILMPAGDWVAGGFNDLINSGEPMPPVAWDPPDPTMDKPTHDQYTSFVNYYIHQVNLMRYLLGEPYKVLFADRTGVVLAGESAGGVACIIEMTPYQTTLDWNEQALIAFEKGYIKLDLPAPLASNRPGRVEVFNDPGNGKMPETLIPTLPWIHAMRQQAINFVRAIKSEIKPPCEAPEALEDLKVALQFLQCWKQSVAAEAKK
ncbi:MAG: Gfo/Idh/MocA family oxidoreductase [Verrucomicrobia bacterium]|nr:Gfo/Idh/MocA family oxidoreductase [Verrucomicrobiota bacterium]MBU4247381.1 Gfo/Idh/MocA family oxidoreductase [Verrucomicrobiota bacterium]MBU4290630.1 Gfo/Idh/MocA family oxidoreductase [Verrucomicrobiota bacterium]MBU4429209.1 Gfo/Idh/MocA family oxidoreductase [Verrucomicrobiota bacterium]MBU4498463.1 Gfo/Idh/MocA family oxidoreductase [Verrucomicrobiota bacterium]